MGNPNVEVHLQAIVGFALGCVMDSNLEINVRDSAALVIATLAESRSKTFGKDEAMLTNVIESLFVLIENSKESAAGALFDSNPARKDDIREDDDDDEEDDTATETSIAQGTLDQLACQ